LRTDEASNSSTKRKKKDRHQHILRRRINHQIDLQSKKRRTSTIRILSDLEGTSSEAKDKKKNNKEASENPRTRQVRILSDLEDTSSEAEVKEGELLVEGEEISNDTEELDRIQKRRAQFHEGIMKIMKEVPSEVKNDFMTPCFAKWSREIYPVLQLNPFDIKPCPATQMWMKMYSNVSTKLRLFVCVVINVFDIMTLLEI
jgi:hypothetical protein